MNDINKLMEDALVQLDEHKQWLCSRLSELEPPPPRREVLKAQAMEIKLQVASADKGRVTLVYEYQDELHAFLRSETTPKDLRDSLAGGYDVSAESQAVRL